MGSVSNVRRKVTWPGTVLMLPHRVSLIMPPKNAVLHKLVTVNKDVSLIVKYTNSSGIWICIVYRQILTVLPWYFV